MNRPRGAEDRTRWVAALTLGCVMAGHTLLETARDALFLANVSVERLPFMTIAIAILALAASRAQQDRSHRSVLLALIPMASVGTLGLWALLAASRDWTYYALYVWSGIVTTLIVVRFWLLLGELFTITQGKRLYAAIAMGGSVGALIGAALATLLAPRFGGEGLLLASTGFFAMATVGPALSLGRGSEGSPSDPIGPVEGTTGLASSLRSVLGSPYACRVAMLVMIGGITLTLGDYLFKSVLAEEISPDRLATVLSRIYLGLNVLSIAMLAMGVTPIVRWIGVDRSLAVLPALIGLGGVGVLAGGALGATIFLKAADGTLRYSLHQTASELLYLPMSSRLRVSVKAAIDIVGQAGARAFASILVLGLVLLPEPRTVVAAAVVAAATIWTVSALRLRRAYLDVFRETLTEGMIETAIDHPELDLESATSLVRALSEPDDRRVRAAMRILTERGHAALIPSLILYHPTPTVVTDALRIFATTEREDLGGLLNRLIDHEDANVRAAAVRASWVLGPDPERLRELAESECTAIRVSAVSGLLALGQVEPDAYQETLEEAIHYETYEPRLAAAAAARLDYQPVTREALLRLAEDESLEVAEEAVRAMCASGDAWFTAPLVGLLQDQRIREIARGALLERGVAAMSVLAEALVDPETPVPIKRHIPRTIAGFDSAEAGNVLVDSLSRIDSGMVRFKILRSLEVLLLGHRRGTRSMIADEVDLEGIETEFERTLERSLELLHLEAELARIQSERPDHATLGGELLVELLQDKRELATRRLFMMLGLMIPQEDFRVIRTGLSSESATDRASAQELVETLLSREVGDAMLGLAMPGSAEALLAVADPGRKRPRMDYDAAMQALVGDVSRSVRAVALYHAGEIGIDVATSGQGDAEGRSHPGDASGSLQERGLAILRELSERGARRARPVVQSLLAK